MNVKLSLNKKKLRLFITMENIINNKIITLLKTVSHEIL